MTEPKSTKTVTAINFREHRNKKTFSIISRTIALASIRKFYVYICITVESLKG